MIGLEMTYLNFVWMREYVLGTKQAVKTKNSIRPTNSDTVQSGRYAPVADVH